MPKDTKVGDKVGRLVVVQFLPREPGRYKTVMCICQCGRTINVDIYQLGRSVNSCGCIRTEINTTRNKATAKFGGMSSDPKTRGIFLAWRSLLNRCCNEKQRTYQHYGAKGIRICNYLKESPKNLAAILGQKPNSKNTLDRFPIHDGNYTCGQCEECKQNGWQLNIRWASRKEQSLNRGDFNVYITAFGKTLTKSQWMELSGLGWNCLTKRLRRGWDVERALTTPDSLGNKLDVLRLVNV